MRRKPSARVASVGVSRTRLAVEEFGWLFRDQPTEDYGIDAHVEVVDGEMVRGRLVALQIKSGVSWFKERGPSGWWFRPDPGHLRYWLNHSLPVVVVLYQPETQVCHWQIVDRSTTVETSNAGWKLLIPEANTLDADAMVPLRKAAERSLAQLSAMNPHVAIELLMELDTTQAVALLEGIDPKVAAAALDAMDIGAADVTLTWLRLMDERAIADIVEHADFRRVAALMETMSPAEFARTLNLMKPRTAVKFLGTRHPDEAVQWLESRDHDTLVAMIDAIVAVVHFSEELDEESRATLSVVLPRVD